MCVFQSLTGRGHDNHYDSSEDDTNAYMTAVMISQLCVSFSRTTKCSTS